MRYATNRLLTLSLLLGIAAASTTAAAWENRGRGHQGPPAQNVNVVNTPTVNAQQQGAWNVDVPGGVMINNTDPISVRTTTAATEPFHFSGGGFSHLEAPADKKLVIKMMSFLIYATSTTPDTGAILCQKLGADGAAQTSFYFPLVIIRRAANSVWFADTRSMHLELQPGEHLEFSPWTSAGGTVAAIEIGASGHLEPVGSPSSAP